MAELSPHRRSGNVPVALDWADRLFNELMPSRIFRELMPSVMKEQGELMPAFDIAEADDHFVVKADLPGIDPIHLAFMRRHSHVHPSQVYGPSLIF
jgi:HSP20 family molecular chaperone IbpA